jgi:hypothetical protein
VWHLAELLRKLQERLTTTCWPDLPVLPLTEAEEAAHAKCTQCPNKKCQRAFDNIIG